ncbi:TspO/MBR family protein [Sphingosinicella rhizophila]|uniref:TspO/MBR family protein n=1 Tax=Sphingosinicella rhizophila TaxID=3050082 RepID=A0ABU3Q4A9_9SPHN|nr:TspO/MBR family protein [Sphingosinicella sp. GR2756]MDT9598253.1 TspO/MBR family protein [Sphingosinicella sp. GR2756]
MTGIASRGQLRMSFLRYALFTAPLILLLGTVSGRIANSGYGNPWFDALYKPEIMPPGWVFGAAWTSLYILLGLALAMVLNAHGARGRGLAISLFLVQLLLNYAWSPVFFALHKVDTAFLIILVMLTLSIVVTLLFARIRSGAAWLMVPYVGWLVFASVLTYQVDQLNPDAERLVPQRGSADIQI